MVIVKFDLPFLWKQKIYQKLAIVMSFWEYLYKRKLHFKQHYHIFVFCLFYLTISLSSDNYVSPCVFVFFFLRGMVLICAS